MKRPFVFLLILLAVIVLAAVLWHFFKPPAADRTGMVYAETENGPGAEMPSRPEGAVLYAPVPASR